MKPTKSEIQKMWCGYCTINILFLLMLRFVMMTGEISFSSWTRLEYLQLFFIGIMLIVVFAYLMLADLYCYLKLPYLHIVLGVGFTIFTVYMLIKEKNIKRFLLTMVLTVSSMALNISWIMRNYENLLTNYLSLQ